MKPTTVSSPPMACVLGGNDVRLWGLDGAERLRRQLHAMGVSQIFTAESQVPAGAAVLLLRADYLFDDRILRGLAARPDAVLVSEGSGTTVVAAAHVSGAAVPVAAAALRGETPATAVPGATVCTPATLSSVYVRELLKAAPTSLVPIRAERRAALERFLFAGAYKGVTDLVTKWLWPAPARQAVRLCVQLGIGPNAVTATGLFLVIIATGLFAAGYFGLGLVLAWTMTFLDTVDGKLARVTVTSTPIGHYFDHVTDVVHPPFWYMAWAYGVSSSRGAFDELVPLLGVMVLTYIAGRLAETFFKRAVAGFSMFSWRPFDSYSRLILARRNPNLLWLTGFWLAGNPRAGLFVVVIWTVIWSVILWVRCVQAVVARGQHGRLSPWLEKLEGDRTQMPAYARPFAPDLASLSHLTR